MKTILYLEDDEHDIFFLKRAFANRAPDLQIRNVANISEAIDYLDGGGDYSERDRYPLPALIVSDVSIPGGSGFQFVRWIRENPRWSDLPIILLTGSAHQSQ